MEYCKASSIEFSNMSPCDKEFLSGFLKGQKDLPMWKLGAERVTNAILHQDLNVVNALYDTSLVLAKQVTNASAANANMQI